MKKLDQILNSSIFRESSAKGIDFLKSVASYFGELIDKDRIVITRIGNENPGEATIVVHCNRGEFLEQNTYILNGTPCQNVTAGILCVHRKGVQKLFPDDTMLVTMDVSCYIGIPLWSMDGRIMGLVAVMDKNPLNEAEAEEISLLLKVISTKIAHSLEGEILATQNLALEERYRKLFDNARPAILILDPVKIADCNKTALRLFSCGKNELIGKTIGFLSPGLQDDLTPSEEKIANFINKALESEVNPFEWTFISREGKVIYSEIAFNRVELGGLVCIEAVINEVSEQKKSALSFREERDFAEMIIDSLPGRFVLYDITYGLDDARLVRINRKWHTEVLGYDKEDMETISPAFFFESNDDSRINSTLKELIEENYVEVELNTMHKRGYIVPMLYRANIFERDGHKYLMAFGLDISERKSAEKALKLSEERMSNIFNSGSDGILVLDTDFRIINANDTMTRMFGYKTDEVIYSPIFNYIPTHYENLLRSRTDLLQQGETLNPVEMEVSKKNGDSIPVEINSKLIRFGDFEGIITVVRDVTERKTYEKKIFNSVTYTEERERERFAKELHDGLGPILSTCKIYLHSLNERIRQEEDLMKVSNRALSLMDDALGSIKEISNNLSPHILRNFGLVHAIVSFTNNLESVSNVKFDIRHRYEERVNEIFEFTVYRILTELINNTVKYAQASLIKIVIELDGPILKVVYSDNGKGFELDKVIKQNKGFGLLNIETRVNKLNGSFLYKTSPGAGVKVEFSLNSNNASI